MHFLRPASIVLTFVVVAALSACAPAPELVPSAPAAASPTPTPTPTTAVAPTLAFGGDCGVMANPAELAVAMGAAPSAPTEFADTGVRSLGGLMCSWIASENSSLVLAYGLPTAVVPLDVRQKYAEPVCEHFFVEGEFFGGGGGCRVAVADDETWVLVTVEVWMDDASQHEMRILQEAAPLFERALADAGSPAAIVRTSEWWAPATCDDIAAGVPLASMLGGEVQVGYPSEFGRDVPNELAVRLGTTIECKWYSAPAGGELSALLFWAYPGGAWDYERMLADEGAERELSSVTVDGTTGAVAGIGAIRPESSYLLATDGVNLLEQLEAPDAAAAAAAVIDALATERR